ncbi:MAG: ATP-binding protein [Rhodothermales bacterium]
MSIEPFVIGTMEMTLESDLGNIERVVDETELFLMPRIEDEDLRYRVVLLATEAVTNAIEHGNRFDADKDVYYRLEVFVRSVEVVVQDQGPGFDPSTTEDPRESANLLREGGRGLLFMQSMADDVRFEEGGRRVRLTFHGG